ncbi:hypothetical protein LTR39_003107 [Cryomyces antarcticus]|nr:hypothetical protein LTR39_003107 [Cryomyces antarcticus]
MDLLQTVRKEGSRGGRAAFSWDDVRTDAQRENYLGHSLMAPVGRWQKGKDLGWYAKGDDKEGAKSAEELRREEIRRIKEAEEDALAAALGLPVPDRASRNANLEPLGKGDVIKAVTEVAAEDEEVEGGRGVGFGGFGGAEGAVGEVEVMQVSLGGKEKTSVQESGLQTARPSERAKTRTRQVEIALAATRGPARYAEKQVATRTSGQSTLSPPSQRRRLIFVRSRISCEPLA